MHKTNTRKNSIKLTAISIIVALALCAVLIPITRITRAHAHAYGDDVITFKETRSGVSREGRDILDAANNSAREFARFDFQREFNNFSCGVYG